MMSVAKGIVKGVAATRGVPEKGLGLVLKVADVLMRVRLGVERSVELKEALSLGRKREEVPGLGPELRAEELVQE